MKTRSVIWKLSDEEFIQVVATHFSVAEILRFFGYSSKGGNFKTVKARIAKLGCDTSHFKNGIQSFRTPALGNEAVFTVNSTYNRRCLKQRIIDQALIPHVCASCGQTTSWNHKPLVLQLEHKNGVSNDNRLENLEFLCPNCHSQTETFAGKACRKPPKTKSPKPRSSKIAWPANETLQQLVWVTPTQTLAKQLGVSGAAVVKHCKREGISKPPRGYWSKTSL